jgi:hypothetical protein
VPYDEKLVASLGGAALLGVGGWLSSRVGADDNVLSLIDKSKNARVFSAFRARRQRLPGGRGDRLDPSQVRLSELVAGQKVEMEHTIDALTAIEIALDHLAEDPAYYTKLSTIRQD